MNVGIVILFQIHLTQHKMVLNQP